MENGWEKYQKQVLNELEDLNNDLRALTKSVIDLRVEMAGLQVKAGMWGAIAGGIPALVAVLAVLWHHFAGG
jgi:hypothetical protein